MQIKCTSILFLALFSVCIIASADNTKDYCNFERLFNNPSITIQEEFAMLLDPAWTPNFDAITHAIAILAVAPPEALNNRQCPIYKYTRDFLEYYKQNKEKITEDKIYITKLLDAVQERLTETIPHKWWQFF